MTQELGRPGPVVGGERHLFRAVRTAHPGTGDRHLAPVERDDPIVAPVAHCHPARVVSTLRPGERLHLVLHHRLHHLEAGPDDEREQPLFPLAGEHADSDAHGVGQHDRRLLDGTGDVLLRLLRRGAAGVPGAPVRCLVVLHVGGP
ncbi:MAG: hypothetical protein ACRDZ5_09475, partial [Acidimicrobiales bacterium]